MVGRERWKDLEPWQPFFWSSQLPAGIYLQSERRPALFPSGHQVDEEIYFAILIVPNTKVETLGLHRYAFRKNLGKCTKRSLRREGYWHFDKRVATSPSKAVAILNDLMQALELLALDQYETQKSLIELEKKRFDKISLSRLVAWEERLHPGS